MLKIFKYLKLKEWLMACVGLGFIVAQVYLDLEVPGYTGKIVQLLKEGGALNEILRNGGWMLLHTFGSVCCSVIVGFLAARIGAGFSRRMRGLLFNKVESFSMEEINRFSTASLITRSTNDVTQVQMLVTMSLQVAIKAPILAVWAVVKIAGKGWQWSLATGIAVAALFVVVVCIMFFVIPKFRKMQVLTDNLTRITRENLTGLRVVRAYNAEGFQEAKFERANKEFTNNNLFVQRVMSVMFPFINLIMSGLTIAIYIIGANLLEPLAPLERVGIFVNLMIFMSYAMQVMMAFMLLVLVFIMFPRAAVSAKRINEVLDTAPTIIDGGITEGLPNKKGEVTFRNVSFKYPDAEEYVLHDVSFTVNQGETIAFIGSTGSGKSTLINLVPRFFDATEGEVFVDGVNVKDYKFESLYNKIGYVPQRAVLFKGTVNSNVAFGDNGGEGYDGDGVKNAVRIAQGADFVEAMDDGYDADIAQGGTNLSGGQKQRLAIARAVCRNPEIYIFDDSFSALDYKTDRVLRSTLKKETAGVTSMIVAQRIGTIMDADQIVVLDEGRVVGKGTHKELLANCTVYREIAVSQLSEEELA